MSEETYQYITLISFKGSLSPGEEGSLCFGERGHFQLAKGTFLSWPDRVILVCFIHFGLLFTEFPAELWEVLLPKVIAPIMDDFIIELYRSWQLFWEHQLNLFENTARYHKAKEASYQDFQQLVETINTNPGDISTKAADLDEINLLPVIALTIRALYSSPADFYKDCVRIMTSVFFDQIGDGAFFVRVGPDQMPMPEDKIFYIYTVDVDF